MTGRLRKASASASASVLVVVLALTFINVLEIYIGLAGVKKLMKNKAALGLTK